jgi:CheY-like chemotaxis protein
MLARSLAGLRVLVAEDNRTNQKVARLMLDRLECASDIADNGRVVLERLEINDYDVILMDMQMPDVDGLEATRRIRAELAPERQPYIIAMTANTMSGDRERCLEAGMDDYIGKPVQREELRQALERFRPRQAAQPAEKAAPAAQWLDPAALEALGSPEQQDEAVAVFLHVTPELLEEIEAGVRARDRHKVYLAAQRLKTAANRLGAKPLAGQARLLEMLSRQTAGLSDTEQSWKNYAPLVEKTRASYESTAAALRKR